MSRYIDADIAVAQITQLKDNDQSGYDLGLDTAINEIKHHMPIENVVEIVRCRDCKHWEKEFRECYSPNWDTGKDDLFVTPPGFYCGWGERSEEPTMEEYMYGQEGGEEDGSL